MVSEPELYRLEFVSDKRIDSCHFKGFYQIKMMVVQHSRKKYSYVADFLREEDATLFALKYL